MPASKLGLGLAAQVNKNNLDGDALTYCSRSGARDVVLLTQFARGVKSLGLWNSMVSWPLLPGQNAGQGVTAYSFGGLGTYDLQLSYAEWTSLGVLCSAGNAASGWVGPVGNSGAILSGAHTFNQPFTVIVAQDYKAPPNIVILHDSPQTFSIFDTGSGFKFDMLAGTSQRGVNSYTKPGRNFVAGFASGSASTLTINSSTEPLTGVGTTKWGPNIGLGGHFTITSFNTRGIETGFACVLSAQPYNEGIRTLYKNTIGRTFNLP